MQSKTLASSILAAELAANDQLDLLTFSEPVTHVYNPLRYALQPHSQYVEKYAQQNVVLLLGMNPGPYGMAQTGVPFGEINHVRDWLGINAAVEKPINEHPKRPIEGFDCLKSEVSGQRLWGWAKHRFETPDTFFARFYVHNYCPLVFMAESGRNITPDKLSKTERENVYNHCDRLLEQIIDIIQPTYIVGVGAFAETRAKTVAPKNISVGKILHPSPASPLANKDWAGQAEKDFANAGIFF